MDRQIALHPNQPSSLVGGLRNQCSDQLADPLAGCRTVLKLPRVVPEVVMAQDADIGGQLAGIEYRNPGKELLDSDNVRKYCPGPSCTRGCDGGLCSCDGRPIADKPGHRL